MSFMLEVYYRMPRSDERESRISEQVKQFGGKLTYREDPTEADSNAICLTYEFDNRLLAEKAGTLLRDHGEHVEGPAEYGPNE